MIMRRKRIKNLFLFHLKYIHETKETFANEKKQLFSLIYGTIIPLGDCKFACGRRCLYNWIKVVMAAQGHAFR